MSAQSPRIAFDNNFQSGQSVANIIRLFGFAITPDSGGYVDIAVDGVRQGRAAYPLSRTDVPNSGWGYTLDTQSFANGARQVVATGFTREGVSIGSASLTLNFANTPPRGRIEGPGQRDPAAGTIGISGWALAKGGIQKLEVLMNGRYVADANWGRPRSDVQAQFPEYGIANSGFLATVNLDSLGLARGYQRIEIIAVNGEGTRQRVTTSEFFYPPGRVGRSYIDLPAPNGSVSTSSVGTRVAGWSEGAALPRQVDFYLNDRLWTSTQTLLDVRSDVPPVFPGAQNVRGFDFFAKTLQLGSGAQRLTAIATDVNGQRTHLDTFTGPVKFTATQTDKLLGAHLRPQNDYGGAITIYSNAMTAKPHIVMYFLPMRTASGACMPVNTFPFLPMRVRDAGAVPMLTWEPLQAGSNDSAPFKYDAILAGRQDACIVQLAREVRDLQAPVMIRFAHEMNGNSNPWTGFANGNNPNGYIAVYRKIVDMFRAEGAANALFVWSPDHASPPQVPAPSNDFRNYYPGDAYVDYIGVSGYNWGNDPLRGGGWVTPQQVFTTFLDVAKREYPGKPILITEVGSVKSYGSNNRAQWYRDFFDFMITRPEVKGVVWFNDYAFADTNQADFRVTDSPGFPAVDPAELAAYREAALRFANTRN